MTPENRKHLAELIENKKQELLAEWRERVRPILAAQGLSNPALDNDIPHFLDELVQKIRDIDAPHSWHPAEKPGLDLETLAKEHGRQRLELGYDVVQIIREYGILREVLIERSEREGLVIGGKGGHVFYFTFNQAIASAVEAFQQAKEEETLKRRKEYLAFVMHDLKTPLNAIMVAAHVIEEQLDDPRLVSEMVHIIIHSGEQLDNLLQKTIKIEKAAEAKGLDELIPRMFELWPLVQSVIDEHRLLATNSHTTVNNLVPSNFTVFGDAVALKTVYGNLLANAIAYTPGGKIVIGVTTSRRDAVECWVRDTGKGIPPKRLEKLFNKVEPDPNKKGSTGLGLAKVKQIIEAHGGTVCAESKVGEGSTFRFTLPYPGPKEPNGATNPNGPH